MRTEAFFSIILILFLLGCQDSVGESVNSANNQQNEIALTQNESNRTVKDEDVWIPSAVEKCISEVNVGEPFEMATFFNPFYLRADFDGNNLIDYAVLIRGKDTKKNGLIICKDSKDPFVFGAISKSKTLLSTFENDNFITDKWDINTKEETKNAALNSLGKSEIGFKAKGESVGFYFDGGSLFIYWDGKSFRIAEGG